MRLVSAKRVFARRKRVIVTILSFRKSMGIIFSISYYVFLLIYGDKKSASLLRRFGIGERELFAHAAAAVFVFFA